MQGRIPSEPALAKRTSNAPHNPRRSEQALAGVPRPTGATKQIVQAIPAETANPSKVFIVSDTGIWMFLGSIFEVNAIQLLGNFSQV
jgi:hypothetical protein